MKPHVIELLLALAARQHGVVSLGQALELGVTRGMLRQAVRRGWLLSDRRGIYTLPGVEPSKWQPLIAAALAAGPDAVISHRSAAVIHGFYGVMSVRPELSVLGRGGHRLAGVTIHHPRDLNPDEIEIQRGVRLTVAIRTVIDLAPMVGDELLGRILDEGAIKRLWAAEQVLARLDALGARGRPGSRRLRQLLALRFEEGNPHSRLEQRVWRVLRPSVPPFEVHYCENFDGERIEMDLAWPELKIDGEVDGMDVRKGSRRKFEHDRHRTNVLGRHGWRIVHFTSQMDDRAILDQLAGFVPVS